MRKFSIIISDEAMDDMNTIVDFIHNKHKKPLTAKQYHKGLIKTIQQLSSYAGSIGRNEYVQTLFGANARHVIFKKMAIIFFIEGDSVYVKRVIAGSLIH